MPVEAVAPLLNSYKYELFRRQLLQTITGGVKVQRLPYYIHLIQWLLWLLPFLLHLPFNVIVFYFNEYYSSAIYGVIIGGTTLLISGFIKGAFLKQHTQIDEVEDDEEILSCCSGPSLRFVFIQKSFLLVLLHSMVSGILSYVASFMLSLQLMSSLLHPSLVVLVCVLGWVSVCVSHYSLLVQPPPEIGIYRAPHTDRLGLRLIRRPVYVVMIGLVFVLLR